MRLDQESIIVIPQHRERQDALVRELPTDALLQIWRQGPPPASSCSMYGAACGQRFHLACEFELLARNEIQRPPHKGTRPRKGPKRDDQGETLRELLERLEARLQGQLCESL